MGIRLHHRVRMGLRSFLRRRTAERELDEELRFHFQQMEAYDTTHESARDEAYGQARRRFGGSDQVKEACRDMRTLRPFEDFLQDLRFGARQLGRSPLFTLVAVLSLALGIGASSAIFSLINAIVLRPLPVEQPEQLHIAEAHGGLNDRMDLFSFPLFERTRALLAGRAELAAMTHLIGMQVRGATESAQVQLVSGEYFDLLWQRPQAGRLLGPADNRTLGGHPVAVISDGYWSRALGRTPGVVGRDLVINDMRFTIVGVTAPGFFGTTVGAQHPDIWLPLMMQAEVRYAGRLFNIDGDDRKPWPTQHEVSWLNIVLRVSPDRAAAAAQAMTLAIHRELAVTPVFQAEAELRRRAEATRAVLLPGARGLSRMREQLTTPLLVLLAMVGLLLAIACTNIASLLLARASSRHREMAVRLSMGAGRWRLVRQLLTESLLLALVGGVIGLLAARWGSAALLAMTSREPVAAGVDVTPDGRVVGATLAVAVVTGLLFGLLPALRSTKVSLSQTLKSQTRGVVAASAGRSRMLTSKLLIAAQIAFSLLLLIVAGLFARSLQELTRVDVGLDRDRLLMVRIDPHTAGYTDAEMPALARRLLDRLDAVPGVAQASLSNSGLFSGSAVSTVFSPEGYVRGPNERVDALEEYVTPGYFETVGLRITRGRPFGPQDTANSLQVTVINETMAKRYFGSQNPIGKRWSYGERFGAADETFEIVGVAADARSGDLKSGSRSMVYLPSTQTQDLLSNIEIRTTGAPVALAADVRRALQETEPRLPIDWIQTLDERVARTLGQERLLTTLTMAFGAVALFLACLGLYGTISYAVTRRTAELGVRMALGADRGAVQWLIMREALALVLTGLAVGIPLAWLAARAMDAMLYGVTPSDPVAHSAAVATLVVVAALAAYLPARRASRVDPVLALRSE